MERGGKRAARGALQCTLSTGEGRREREGGEGCTSPEAIGGEGS